MSNSSRKAPCACARAPPKRKNSSAAIRKSRGGDILIIEQIQELDDAGSSLVQKLFPGSVGLIHDPFHRNPASNGLHTCRRIDLPNHVPCRARTARSVP